MPFMMVRPLFFLILLFQGTIPILCQPIFGHLRPTHYICQHKLYSNERQQKRPFSEPTHPVFLLT